MENYHLYFASCVRDGGIWHYTLQDGTLHREGKTPCDRPMYLYAEDGKLWALLRRPFADGEESGLLSFTLDPEGHPVQAGEPVSTRGVVACHLCRWKGEIYAANYLSGSIWSLSGALDVHEGKGIHPVRQEAPHTHYVMPAPDGACLLAVDLGLDAVYSYDASLNILNVAHVPAGHGARHLAYSEDGRTVFCANELASTVTVFSYGGGKLIPGQTVSALGHPAESTAAAIRVKGEYVYVSNRGDDSISCLHWNGKNLELCSVTPCGGASPRDFLIVEDLLICTNETGNSVTLFRVEGDRLKDTGERIPMDAPLCVVAQAVRI